MLLLLLLPLASTQEYGEQSWPEARDHPSP
jgi:hypothetical protein